MKTEELIDHLKAGRPLTKNVVKQIIYELEWNATLRMENRAHQEQLGFYRERMESAEQRVKALEDALRKVRDRFFPLAQPERDRDILWDEVNEALEATCQKR